MEEEQVNQLTEEQLNELRVKSIENLEKILPSLRLQCEYEELFAKMSVAKLTVEKARRAFIEMNASQPKDQVPTSNPLNVVK